MLLSTGLHVCKEGEHFFFHLQRVSIWFWPYTFFFKSGWWERDFDTKRGLSAGQRYLPCWGAKSPGLRLYLVSQPSYLYLTSQAGVSIVIFPYLN